MQTLTRQIFKALELGTNSPEFQAHWENDLDIVAIRDEHSSKEDMEGDLFNTSVNGFSEAKNNRLRKAYHDSLDLHGIWGLGITKGGKPLWETFTWGYEGEDLVKTALGEAKHFLQLMTENREA